MMSKLMFIVSIVFICNSIRYSLYLITIVFEGDAVLSRRKFGDEASVLSG
jgi:hypothetical protein